MTVAVARTEAEPFTIEHATIRGPRKDEVLVKVVAEGDSAPDVFIPQLIDLYLRGRFPFDKLVKFYDLEQINQADADNSGGGTLKAILRMPY